jgi:hypothetical protein
MEAKQKKILIGVGVGLAILLSTVYFANAASASKTKTPLPPTPPKPDPKVDPVVDPTNPVNNDENYTFEQLADALEMAFQGYGTAWTTGDAGGVTGVISQLKSDADFDALDAAYAQRRISSGTFNIFAKDYVGDMNGAFKSELSKSEIEEINMMLANQGIKRKIQ